MRKLRVRIGIREMAFAISLFLLLPVVASAQVTGSLFKEAICEPGKSYELKIDFVNASDKIMELEIVKRDFDFSGGGIKFLKPDSVPRSNSSWILMASSFLQLDKKRKTTWILKVYVPPLNKLKKGLGTYYSLFQVKARLVTVVKGKRMFGLVPAQGIQILTHVRENKAIPNVKNLMIKKVEISEDYSILKMHLHNPGAEAYLVKIAPQLENVREKRDRVFPGQTNIKEFDISKLPDKLYENIRVLFDDEDVRLWAEKITFRKGQKPEDIKYTKLKGKKIKSRRTSSSKPYRLYAVANYGTNRKGFGLQGNLNLGAFFLQSNASFRGYEMMGNNVWRENYRTGIGYRSKNFRFGVARSFFDEGRMNTRFDAGIYLRDMAFNFGYYMENNMLSISAMKRVFKKYTIRFYGNISEYRKDFNFSIMIPIL